ncbi:glutathione S-transferase [Mesobacterium pallidum]|uniref:glutathione S-transferase n=1 Tax=Mesobacterium pallidum TaxID=2872037 RepID=UPI001EE2598F|nr:glutathione S-transferase [Mesobacterium pallidum]
MQLISSPASPFVRKVRAVLRETGLVDAVEELVVATSALKTAPEAAAANPLGKIPALIRNDGPALYDSRVITRFLDARAGGKLYPEARIWEVLTLEATADGIAEAAVLMIYEKRLRPEAQQSPEWIEGQWAKVTRALDALDARWMSHLHGPVDMGHIAVACALGYLDFRHGGRDWRSGREALADWYDKIKDRPSLADTAPVDP